MAADTALSRIQKSEFFAILAPGIYVVSAASLIAIPLIEPTATSPWQRIIQTLRGLAHDWPIVVVGVFFAYLIGSVLRAVPVNIADRLCKRLFGWTARDPDSFDGLIYRDHFPYSKMLDFQLQALQKSGIKIRIRWPLEKGTSHTMFNYWKAALCLDTPAAFVYAQELEGRVRLFAGMFWAGILGLLVCTAGVCLLLGPLPTSWFGPLLVFVLLSLTIAGVFGWRLRRVRADEAVRVFIAFLRLSQRPVAGVNQPAEAGDD